MLERGRRLVSGFTAGQRAMVVVAVLALVLGAVALTRWVAQPTWTTLYSQLSPTDASAVVDQLQAQNVQYQLVGGGTTILVPQSQVYSVRVTLAGKGLPANDGGSGWSILDKQGMTATDFQQNTAYQRALEGELAKTLGAMTGVKAAIVHLAIPKKDVFTTVADKPTAAVLLQLTPGTTLSRQQVRSVTQLVAGSVPGLDPSNVTLTDGNGNLLSTPTDAGSGAASMANDADQQTALFEDRMNTKVQQMLDSVLGPGHAVVKVNAELNFDATDVTSENYVSSPGATPLSEATSVETYGGGSAPAGGALGVVSPTPLGGSPGASGYYKADRTVNYGIGKIVTNDKKAPGAVKRLSVAVVLDSSVKGTTPTQVEALVKEAAGIVQARGDTVKVDSLAFSKDAADAAAKELAAQQKAEQTAQYIDLGKKAGLVLLAIVAGIIMMRRNKKAGDEAKVTATASDLQDGILMPAQLDAIGSDVKALTAEGAPLEIAIPETVLERERLRDEVSGLVDSQPDEMAALVQGWLSERKA
jgi:flagellar M-ring protein FliF